MPTNELCNERHERIEDRLDVHDTRLDAHDKVIHDIQLHQTRYDVLVEQVCDRVVNLTRAIWWFIGTIITLGFGFIVWYIQTK